MTAVRKFRGKAALAAACLALSACSSTPPASVDTDSAPSSSATPSELPPDAVPRREPRSRYGNPAFYEVYGVRYEVMDSSHGYHERGVASWYGTKFHGKATSSQEPYDMHAMTAAHKTLPLPTYVRVRNLSNNRSVVVRVNDRGPFIDNRIIDLSYAAATKLDMVRAGTSLVEVTAINLDAPAAEARPTASTVESAAAPAESLFVQAGAFGDVNNARRRYSLLRENGIDKAFVHRDESRQPPLYRIRVGPIGSVAEFDEMVDRLKTLGISETHLVSAE